MLHGILFADRFMWFTPSWLVAAGITVGLLILLALWGLILVINRRAGVWCREVAGEGLPQPLLVLGGLISLYTVCVLIAGIFQQTNQFPIEMFGRSLSRMFISDTSEATFKLGPAERHREITLDISPVEVENFTLTVDGEAEFQRFLPNMPGYSVLESVFKLTPGQPYFWQRSIRTDKNDLTVGKYFFSGGKVRYYATNNTNQPVTLTMKVLATSEYPQTAIIPWTALMVVLGFVSYYVLRAAFPRMMAVAGTTMKETLYQPLFYLLLAFMVGVIFIQLFLPQNTFGDDVKPFKYNNLTLFTWVPVFLTIWTASQSITDEIEGRTALTVLSKPIGRVEFILGKYLGVMFPVVLLFCVCGAFFIGAVPFKVVYDARESAALPPNWEICFDEMRHILPGLALTFMECMVLAAICVAISTRLPMLANLVISGTIYIVGHLLPQLVQSSRIEDKYRILEFSARFFAAIFPVLENYKIDSAIVEGKEVPWHYLGAAMGYTGCYCAFALLLSLLLFETRDVS